MMKDGAPYHKGAATERRKEYEQMGWIGWGPGTWPSNSQDLNPIENIWSYIKDIIARDYAHITSVKTMKQVVIRLWNEFADNQWDNLIESMPDRVQAVIAARGGSTRY